MNATDRKTLQTLKETFDSGPLSTIKDALEEARDREQEKRDNLPESLQDGEQATKLDEAIEALEEAAGKMDEAIEAMSEAQDLIDKACES